MPIGNLVLIMMKEKEAKNCWEFMKCPKYIKENCEAYKRGLGQRCWQIAENEVAIHRLEDALHALDLRKRDREARGVEGTSQG